MYPTLVLFAFIWLLTGCSEQVTVVAIEHNSTCQEEKSTTLDGTFGRFKRCGIWGTVGEKFRMNRM
jgi:hypothetical protein